MPIRPFIFRCKVDASHAKTKGSPTSGRRQYHTACWVATLLTPGWGYVHTYFRGCPKITKTGQKSGVGKKFALREAREVRVIRYAWGAMVWVGGWARPRCDLYKNVQNRFFALCYDGHRLRVLCFRTDSNPSAMLKCCEWGGASGNGCITRRCTGRSVP